MIDFAKLADTVSSRVSEYRFRHTMGVVRAIEQLSDMYMPSDRDELRCAALLHDIAKEMPYKAQIELLTGRGVDIDEFDSVSMPTLHQLSGAEVVRAEFPELDPRIAEAIAKHSTGDGNMSLFDKLLYIADYIEETRTNDFCTELRQKFFDGIEKSSAEEYHQFLDEIILFSLDKTMQNLISKGAFIHEKTFEARNSLIRKLDGKRRLVTF